jgi:uracil phosphoribosyltransferase
MILDEKDLQQISRMSDEELLENYVYFRNASEKKESNADVIVFDSFVADSETMFEIFESLRDAIFAEYRKRKEN